MNIRMKFKKHGCMKFIGHLDIMRYFQKAIRRAEIDIAYSEGFSPHMIMSFAAPLGVGITSDGEYLDIEVHSTKSSKEMIDDLNTTMVEGVEIVGYVELPETAKPAMSIVAAADYILSYKEGYEVPFTVEEWKKHVEDLFASQKSFVIMKKTKKSEREAFVRSIVDEVEKLQDVMEDIKNKSFDLGIGVVATKKSKRGIYYTSRIHTNRDIEVSSDNIYFLNEEISKFIENI